MTLSSSLKLNAIKLLDGRFVSTVFGSLRRRYIPIFMMHRMEDKALGVSGHNAKFLRQALAYFRDHGYTLLSLDDVVASLISQEPLPNKSIVITLDDGFYDQVEIAGPIFAEFDCPATIFLLSNFADGISWPWDYQIEYIVQSTPLKQCFLQLDDLHFNQPLETPEQQRNFIRAIRSDLKLKSTAEAKALVKRLAGHLDVDVSPQPPAAYRAINWDQARAWEKRGIRFGAHSAAHSILANQTDENSQLEIQHSLSRLREELVNPSEVFCYPTGRYGIDFGQREIGYVKASGCKAAVSVNPGYVDVKAPRCDTTLYALNRFSFPSQMTDLIQYCSWIERMKELVRS